MKFWIFVCVFFLLDSGILRFPCRPVRYECCIQKRAKVRPPKKQISHWCLQCFEEVRVSWGLGGDHKYMYIYIYVIYIYIQVYAASPYDFVVMAEMLGATVDGS